MPVTPIVVIGASAGGIDALRAILSQLPRDFPAPIAVVIHIAPHSPGILGDILDRSTPLTVRHPENGDRLANGVVFVAPPDHHLIIEPGRAAVVHGPRENRFRPAIDPLFRTAAQVFGPAAIGVVLTGNLDDGTAGLKAIKQLGGTALVQDPLEAEYPSMPQNAARNVRIDHLLPLAEIPRVLVRLVAASVHAGRELAVPEPIHVESRIARGESPLDAGLERIAEPSMFACPECHGVLLALKESQPLRFRCHTGHAYTAHSLMADVGEMLEHTLWAALRGMQEASMLAHHLAAHAEARGDTALVQQLEAQRKEMQQRAERVRELVKDPQRAVKGSAAEQ